MEEREEVRMEEREEVRMEGKEEGRVNACEIIKCVKYLVSDRVSDLTVIFAILLFENYVCTSY